MLLTKEGIWITGNRGFKYYRIFGVKLEYGMDFLDNLKENCYSNTISIGVYTEDEYTEIMEFLEKRGIVGERLSDEVTEKIGIDEFFIKTPPILIDWIKIDPLVLSEVFKELRGLGYKTLWRSQTGGYIVA